ncbi:hypothetical protein OCU04_002085 [Sclerotinia nivalis]|uniref:Hydrophobin n=1 Tax=Sclerotinia nivalis TaxID=352851 RepID=A0A9X0AZU4_9HELO|nr:hypothetical protein OCU04_002085 [Sclerotinia nivalis]
MRASFTAIVTGLMALNVAALPGGTPASSWGSSSPTGTPSCAGSKYTCKTAAPLSLLSCTNILNGVIVSIPISLKERGIEERAVEARTSNQNGDYCCTAAGLLTLSCLNVGNGLIISLPITA